MLEAIYKFFTSVRLAVVLLACGLILVFWGTIAQVKLGLYQAQNEFFRSLFIYWHPAGSSLRIPITTIIIATKRMIAPTMMRVVVFILTFLCPEISQ